MRQTRYLFAAFKHFPQDSQENKCTNKKEKDKKIEKKSSFNSNKKKTIKNVHFAIQTKKRIFKIYGVNSQPYLANGFAANIDQRGALRYSRE